MMRPDERTIRARRREIANRYAWDGRRRKRRPTYSKLDNLRLREIERFFDFKYGEILPDDCAGRDELFIAVCYIIRLAERPDEAAHSWARSRAPWCPPDEVTAIVDRAFDEKPRWRADKLAWRLGLTDAVRTLLDIRTIGSVDVSKAQRIKRAKVKDGQRKAADRRAAGSTPREKSIAHLKPWEPLGMSRATWYRKRKRKPPLDAPRETDET